MLPGLKSYKSITADEAHNSHSRDTVACVHGFTMRVRVCSLRRVHIRDTDSCDDI